MPPITTAMIRKKSEHNPGLFSELEEISLHQMNINKIEVIQHLCKRMKILYLQNNHIEKIENVYKLKELNYLNLAVNTIQVIEGLRSCEKLKKLDLTVNFIEGKALAESLDNLKMLRHFTQLYLTGNPCVEERGYRPYVIASLPTLQKLDGKDITKSERILAKQQFEELDTHYRSIAVQMTNDADGYGSESEEEIEFDDKGDRKYKYTPGLRRQMYQEEEEERLEKEKQKRLEEESLKPPDPIKAAREKLSQKVILDDDETELPRQRNTGRVEFHMREKRNIIEVEVEVPRYMETAMIDVDIHPKWLQVVTKGRNLLIHTPCEVLVEQSKAQRIMTSGHLLLTLQKVRPGENFEPVGFDLLNDDNDDDELVRYDEQGNEIKLSEEEIRQRKEKRALARANANAVTVKAKKDPKKVRAEKDKQLKAINKTKSTFLRERKVFRSPELEAQYQEKQKQNQKAREREEKAERLALERLRKEKELLKEQERRDREMGYADCDSDPDDITGLDMAELGLDPDDLPPDLE